MVPISCQSEGALEIYIEPVLPVPHLVIVGSSPMTHTLAELARALDWRTDLVSPAEFTGRRHAADERSMVVVATQGHGDEDMIERAAALRPAYLGLVASRRRGEAVLGYLAERGVPKDQLDRVHAPAGLDLGKTTHEEMAVAILAELVQLRASGAFADAARAGPERKAARELKLAEAVDPVCGMTVTANAAALPLEHDGVTYYFCCAGCRRAFERESGCLRQGGAEVIITSDFEVAEPVEKVWRFFDNIPQVASCLPGAELTKDLGDDKYEGRVAIRMGPVRLQFTGTADITERDEAAKQHRGARGGRRREGPRPGRHGGRRHAVAEGPRHQGRGHPGPAAVRRGGAVRPGHDLRRLRHLDARLLREHAGPDRAARARRVGGADRRRRAPARPGLHHRPAGRADGADPRLPPVLPALPARGELTESSEKGGPVMVLWWIGNVILLVVVLPVVIYLLNRVLAALERIRAASDDILAGGVALIGELQGVPDGLAVTDQTIEAVKVGAVRYAGSVAKLLG